MENQDGNKLNEVKEEFRNWRENRPGKKGATPEELKNKAIKLLEKYPLMKVSKELSVYPKQLKTWQNNLNSSKEKENSQETEISFLETTSQQLIQSQTPSSLPSPPEPLLITPSITNTSTKKQTPQLCSVVIERTDGNRLIAQLSLNVDNLDVLFSFIKA